MIKKRRGKFVCTGYTCSIFRGKFVYGCGEAHGRKVKNKSQPEKIEIPKNIGRIVDINLKGGHFLFLTDKGKVFSCGNNCYGQCGNGNKVNVTTVSPIKGLNRFIVTKFSGCYNSIFVTKHNGVFACGENGAGQCGVGIVGPCLQLKKVKNLPEQVVELSTNYHTLFVLASGNVYSCGTNTKNQCGNTNPNSLYPTLVPYFKKKNIKIVNAKVGNYHSIFLDFEGKVYTCGGNSHGACGVGNRYDVTTITENTSLRNKRIQFIEAGYYNSAFIDSQLHIYACGRNSKGELDKKLPRDTLVPTLLQWSTQNRVLDISLGYESSIFLNEKGEIFSGGTNSHGQLGQGNFKYFSNGISKVERLKLEFDAQEFIEMDFLGVKLYERINNEQLCDCIIFKRT